MENGKYISSPSLQYITDALPGISRKKKGEQFVYFYPDGKRVNDETVLARIKSLAIPPAYQNVWISPIENSHLQATARDSKNRKQYRYHPLWRKIREENKFMSMIPFGTMLPKIRKHIHKELSKPLQLNKNQIICAIIYLLDNHFIRIGNVIYEKQNKSYGLTTLRKKHLSLSTTKAILKFEGKNSKPWHVVLKDKKLIRLLKKCESLPGYRLFKYIDENNVANEITSQDINTYLQQLTQYSFTAKDFRTWGACREALFRLARTEYQNDSISLPQLKKVISEVSEILGHTPSICQKCYIFPEIITLWKEKKIQEWIKKHYYLKRNKDRLLLLWLEEHLKQNQELPTCTNE